ncbi:MAG TPA: hypothetical protein VMV72_13485 [Verrucomicrobiae bacterium]|nr:hypothetical protein [Verrucomicrobiae bacterium]
MWNKVFAGLVIAFWAAMMTALVRVEIYPQPTIIEPFSSERIIRKVFANPEPLSLDIYSNASNHIGHCTIEIQPQMGEKSGVDSNAPPKLVGYKVHSDLKIRLSAFGMPSRLSLDGDSIFDKNLDLRRFQFNTDIGEGRMGSEGFGYGHVNIVGDDRTKMVRVEFDFGEFHDERLFDFDQIKGGGFANAFGLPGMANFSFLGGGGLPTAFGAAAGEDPRAQPTTTVSIDRLQIAGTPQRVYLVYTRLDNQIWTKMWIDEAGQVLKVVTSMGLEMRSDVALGDGDHPVRHHHRYHYRRDGVAGS